MTKLRRPCLLTVVALLLGACDGSIKFDAHASAPPQLRREGRWLVDPQNRVVLLHGVNLVWKVDPFVPPATAEGFLDADAQWLADNGFNSARLGTLWVGISPHAAGEVSQDYLEAWDRVVRSLAAQRIWMLFDFHQDLLGPLYGGEGVPEWVVESVRGPSTDLLGPPAFGFPFNYFSPQLSEAFDNLWADPGPIRDGFRAAWMGVAQRWSQQPYSMGYDLLNEPWAGLDYPTCLIPLTGCPSHDAASLQPFFDHARRGIRSIDPHNLVWFESQPLISTGAPTGFTAIPGESQLGYSFHYYC
ncbi:MAG: cellulase family glycosylhydrolase, partial [Panacagrimonas sp.]